MESVQQTFQGPVDFGKKCTATISRTGDLAYTMWLQVTLPNLRKSVPFVPEPPHPFHPTITNTYFENPTTMVVESVPPTSPGFDSYTCFAADVESVQTSSNLPRITNIVLTSTGSSRTAQVTFDPVPEAASYTLYCRQTSSALGTVVAPPVTVDGGTLNIEVLNLPTEGTLEFCVSAIVGGQHMRGPPIYAVTPTASATGTTFKFEDVRPRTTYVCRCGATKMSGPNDYALQLSRTQRIIMVRWCDSVGHALVQSVELEIGGTRIDRHVSEWLDIRSELTEKEEKLPGFRRMVGKYEKYDIWDANCSNADQRYYFVPLVFYANRNAGLAIPLIALQFHEVKLNFEFRPFKELIQAHSAVTYPSEPGVINMRLYVDYVFLDQPERIRFAQMPHEYLIEQVQYHGAEPVIGIDNPVSKTLSRKINLNLNHPVKELVWVYSASKNVVPDASTGNTWFDYDIPDKPDAEIFKGVRLQLNGADRFNERPGEYFRYVQPYQHHTRIPSKKVHVYSFALHPEDPQPSGTCNMSRLDTVTFVASLSDDILTGRIHIFATSYNVLRITNGMAGLAFVTT